MEAKTGSALEKDEESATGPQCDPRQSLGHQNNPSMYTRADFAVCSGYSERAQACLGSTQVCQVGSPRRNGRSVLHMTQDLNPAVHILKYICAGKNIVLWRWKHGSNV